MVTIHEAKQSDIKRLLELSLMKKKIVVKGIEPIQKMTFKIVIS